MKILALILVWLGIGSITQGQSLIVDKAKSQIGFTIKNGGFNTDGSFKAYTVTLNWNEQDLSKCSLEAKIEATSIDTDNGSRDGHLRKPDYFDVLQYPHITFKSTGVKKLSESKFEITGSFTIKEVSKTIVLIVNRKIVGEQYVWESAFELNRVAYHVGEESWVMDDKVKVKLIIFSTFK